MPVTDPFEPQEISGVQYLVPDWPVSGRIRSLFTLRKGGVSTAPYDSFNLGSHVGDAPEAVQQNRQRLQAVVGALSAPGRGGQLVFLNQVHGCGVVGLQPQAPQQDATDADAVLATQSGQVCVIMVADCLPVLFALPQAGVVAAAHAGWRGLAGDGRHGVLEAVFARFVAAVQQKQQAAEGTTWSAQEVADHTLVWLGPCIGKTAFEVGADVRDAFMQSPLASTMSQECFDPAEQNNKWRADLAALARWRLRLMGLHRVWGNDSSAGWCTYTNAERYFSHRRDSRRLGGSGRMAACIWLTETVCGDDRRGNAACCARGVPPQA